MNMKRFAGLCREIAGKTEQLWGQFRGDPIRTARGHRNALEGQARQRDGAEQEAAAHQLRDFLYRNRHWHH